MAPSFVEYSFWRDGRYGDGREFNCCMDCVGPQTDENRYQLFLSYNIVFTVLTYFLPIISMTVTYARRAIKLWGSKAIRSAENSNSFQMVSIGPFRSRDFTATREVLTSRHSYSGSPEHHRIIRNDTER